MKAIKYHGVKQLHMIDIEKPEPGVGEVLVKVIYCAICGTDVHAYNSPGIFDWDLVLGHEAVGIVEKIGSGVSDIKVGDRVAVGPPGDCGACYSCNEGHPNTCKHAFQNTIGIGPETQGAYAEYVLSCFPQNQLIPIPDDITMEQAVLFDVLGVGFHALRKSNFKIGDKAVVCGCGSIGLSVIQAAKLSGARCLLAFDPVEKRRQQALAAGADYVFDSNCQADIQKAKELLAYEGGAHVTFEAAGRIASLEVCINLTMANGQVMIVGNDGVPYELYTAKLGPMEFNFQFSFTFTKEEISMLFDMISTKKWDTSIYTIHKSPLEDAEKKILQISSGELDVGRVLLMPNGEVQ